MERQTSAAQLERDAEEFVLHANRGVRSIVFERGLNARLWDIHGKEFLDTMSGSAGPAMVGHSNPVVARAVAAQMAELPSHNLRHYNVPVIEYCKRLAQIAPEGLTKTFICPGGGEAVEAAIKFAIRVTGRSEVLALTGAYHGMSLAMMALAGMSSLKTFLPDPTTRPPFSQIASADPYRSLRWEIALEELQAALGKARRSNVAALVLELVQGPNGHVAYPAEYYKQIQVICREHDVLLIVDEIQTGLARCGALWASDFYGVQPDILVAGKALGGGVPMGALITRRDLIPDGMESEPWHMLTFMNQPLAAAAGIAVLDVVRDEKLVERARSLGALATQRFKKLAEKYSVIGDVRGPGLFIGVDYVQDRASKIPATAACQLAWEKAIDIGLIVQFGGVGSNVLKFKPPLTTPMRDFTTMLDLCEEITSFIQREIDSSAHRRSVNVR